MFDPSVCGGSLRQNLIQVIPVGYQHPANRPMLRPGQPGAKERQLFGLLNLLCLIVMFNTLRFEELLPVLLLFFAVAFLRVYVFVDFGASVPQSFSVFFVFIFLLLLFIDYI